MLPSALDVAAVAAADAVDDADERGGGGSDRHPRRRRHIDRPACGARLTYTSRLVCTTRRHRGLPSTITVPHSTVLVNK